MEQVPTLLVNDKKLKDPKNGANAFNNIFTAITENLNIQHIEKGDAILIIKDAFAGKFSSIKIIPINEAEIKNIMLSLKPKKSSGYDEITSKILKACPSLSIKLHLK